MTYMHRAIKRAGRYIVDHSIVPIIRYTIAQTYPAIRNPLYDMAKRRAIESSLEYVQTNMPSAPMFANRLNLWDCALNKISVSGLCIEFGVWEGESINYFASKLHTVYGFDSFEGLKEDWQGREYRKGTFNRGGILPKVAKNVHLVKGWFDNTVPEFLAEHPEPFAFVHIDCDTFETTTLLLELIGPKLVVGTVIVFDEYFGYRGWEVGEYKAWSNYVLRANVNYEYLGFASQQVAIRLTLT